MATYFAQSSSNINASNVWNTATNGSGSYLTWPPASGDVLMANNRTITVNVDTNLGAGEVRNDATGGATAGGYFDLSSNVTLTANVYAGGSSVFCVRYNLTGSANIVGNVYGSSTTSANVNGAANTSSGVLNITGNAIGGSIAGNAGVRNSSTGLVAITGGAQGSAGIGAVNISTGIITITGAATGGAAAAAAHGAGNYSTGTIRVYGTCTGSSATVAAGLWGDTIGGLAVAHGSLVSGATGAQPLGGFVRVAVGASTTITVRNESLAAIECIPITYATTYGFPAASDVRYGISYAQGIYTGSAHIPAAASVLYGVPVDATTGTVTITASNIRAALGLASANLDTQLDALPTASENATAVWGAVTRTLTSAAGITAQDVWEYATRTLTAGSGITAQDVWEYATREITGGTVTTLTNAPDVPTEAEIAEAVRTELTPELSRMANCATVESTGDQLAGLL